MTVLTREQVRLSKRLSFVLRHRPEVAGLTLDATFSTAATTASG